MRIKGRIRSRCRSKCWMSRTHKSRVACVFTAPVWRSTPSENIESRWNRSGSPSRYPYIPTFGGRSGLSFALELPKQPSLRSSSRAGHNQIFLPHERSPFESAPAARSRLHVVRRERNSKIVLYPYIDFFQNKG